MKQFLKHIKAPVFFEYIEPHFKGQASGKKMLTQTIPNDNYFSRQYGLVNDGSFSLAPAKPNADIDMDLVWDIEKATLL